MLDLTPLTTVIVDGLAAHRITRLVTADVISQPLRDRVLAVLWTRAGRAQDVRSAAAIRGDIDGAPGVLYELPLSKLPEGSIQGAMREGHLPDPPKLATLITCRWCAGVYVAAAVVGLSAARIPGWRTLMRVAATASCAALLAAPEDDQ